MNPKRLIIPALSLAGLLVAAYTIQRGNAQLPVMPLQAEPARPAFPRRISGAGLIESASEDIVVGLPVSGRIAEIFVQRGQKVERDAPLLRLETAPLEAALATRRAQLGEARAELAHLKALPRKEDLPPREAAVSAARAELEQAAATLALLDSVRDPRAVSEDVRIAKRSAVQQAQARHELEQAQLERLRAGAFGPEIDAAGARVLSAEAAVNEVEVELNRRTVRAPIAGTVLQLHARVGEWAEAGSGVRPLVLLGDLSRMHVRVDIDENDAWRFRPGAKGVGFVKGNGQLSTPLEFVRVDPYVLPKRSLTGDSFERVDTRVLQVIYAFAPEALPVYPGQQMDVFLEAEADALPGVR
ncbi:MAG: HlyD family secretion protein [Planctomycetia bacterium]